MKAKVKRLRRANLAIVFHRKSFCPWGTLRGSWGTQGSEDCLRPLLALDKKSKPQSLLWKDSLSGAWWHTLVFPTLRMLRQEDPKSQASLDT